MTRKTLLTIIAATAAAACVRTGGPPFSYAVPSPANAVYQVDDSMSIEIDAPAGGMTITGAGSVTIGLDFQADRDGLVYVEGTVEAFEGFMTNPMMGTRTANLDDVSGSLAIFISRQGVEEIALVPVLSGPVAQMSSFPAMAFLLFPRMPGGDVDPGATWVDTVTASTDADEWSTSSTTISTYTVVGDTLVDGRTLVHIAVATEITTETEADQGGMSITQNTAGSADGFFLWDLERGLVVQAEYERDVEGTMSAGNMGTMGMAVTGPTRIRLER